jgi:hypothetical protein
MGTMRLVRNVLKVLVGLVALAVVAYFAGNGLAVAAGVAKRHRVAHEVTDLLVRVLPGAEAAQQEVVEEAGREPERRWIEQACSFETDESGWIVVDRRETCVLRTVTAWRVDSEREAAGVLVTSGTEIPAYDGCTPLGTAGRPGVVDGPEATYVDSAAATEGEPWCVHDLGTSDDARAVAGERASLASGRWLLLVAEQPLVDESIGCVHWSLIFCDNPWTSHAFGDAPGS